LFELGQSGFETGMPGSVAGNEAGGSGAGAPGSEDLDGSLSGPGIAGEAEVIVVGERQKAGIVELETSLKSLMFQRQKLFFKGSRASGEGG
jgi:hypothetical protein